ncbi:vWA domain-containing protein [Sandaracinus amylolyticus]|uniref:vWA domain-containing protein n=1 Tax=Sandaracinus amylolyticus TaxID=927083 RepID=UPI001F45D923|nr:vWA domain-containing protein [Sandaracinus amylolyticus]UJR84550.1 Hypothetical protein I5071_66290 [Sandaracinus amylolyticus]
MKPGHFFLLVLSLTAACTERGDDSFRPPLGDAGSFDAGTTNPPHDGGGFPDVQRIDAGVCTDSVDVVFVIDVSSSMNFVLEELEDDVGMVVDAATELAPDPHFGFIGYVDNHAFATNGALEGGRVHTQASTLQSAFRQFLTTYTNPNRNPGDGPGGPTTQNPICEENALDALHAAATEFPWRPNATRVIIIATDDTFIEPTDNYGDRDHDGDWTSTDYPREGNYPALHSMAQTIAAVRSARARVFSFTRLSPPGFLSRCGTDRRLEWSQITNGWSAPYNGAAPIPDSTDGRNFDLAMVQSGSLSLATTINDVVIESYCQPPLF